MKKVRNQLYDLPLPKIKTTQKIKETFSFGHTTSSQEHGLVKEGQRKRGKKHRRREELSNGLPQHHHSEEISS
jgi:hypothetical protein